MYYHPKFTVNMWEYSNILTVTYTDCIPFVGHEDETAIRSWFGKASIRIFTG
jgi:hypothetical protein